MQFPPLLWPIVLRMFNERRFNYPSTEDGSRQWTLATTEQLKFVDPNGGWCSKSAGPGRPRTKDVIARRIGGRFDGWGVLTASGALGPRVLTDPPEHFDLTGQLPIDVNAVDHLGIGGGGGGGEEPDPTNIPARVARLERIIDRLRGVLASED